MTVLDVILLVLLLVSAGLIVLLLKENRRLRRELVIWREHSDSWQTKAESLRIKFDARWHKSGRRIHDELHGNEPTRDQVNRLTPGVYYCEDE